MSSRSTRDCSGQTGTKRNHRDKFSAHIYKTPNLIEVNVVRAETDGQTDTLDLPIVRSSYARHAERTNLLTYSMVQSP